MNQDQHARRLLDRLKVRHPCDLDLLVFFARHPRTLLTSEQLANFLGYPLAQIADSLEVLVKAEFLTRTQTAAHAARLYVFAAGGGRRGGLPELFQLTSTREGLLALKRALTRSSAEGLHGHTASVKREGTTAPGPRPFVVVRRPEDAQKPVVLRRGRR